MLLHDSSFFAANPTYTHHGDDARRYITTTPISFFPNLLSIDSRRSNTKIIFILLLFFDNHRSTWDYLFFFWPHKLSDRYVQTVPQISSFLNILLTMWEPSWSHFLWKWPCHTHIFPFFIFLGGDAYFFCSAHLVIQGGLRFVILLWIPCVDYREGECYAQLCLSWIPGNPSLWIPVPPVSLYFSDVRFTTWTYPSHSLADIWFNACSVASHTALCFTHILIILK